MSDIIWANLVAVAAVQGVTFAPGLSDAEVAGLETEFTFRFPDDLRGLLQAGLPTGLRFPDWRNADRQTLRQMLDWPLEGICFDIEHNNFWLPAWGPRPPGLKEALELATRHMRAAPRLIPVSGHRYLPDRPVSAGNPVYSVWQTDIIYYGWDLTDCLTNEFHISNPRPRPAAPRPIEFWSDLVG